MNRRPALGCALASVLAFTWMMASANASTIWDEGVSGDLSDNQATPNAFNLALGTNSIIGTVGGGNSQDWVALTVPVGLKLGSLVLADYQSTDAQGFSGVQVGASFVGSAFSAASYLGYVHYGTGATNGALPPTNLIGADLLPLMGNTTLAAGAAGFSGALPSGTYTFLIQQLGASTRYQFNYNLVAVPEPSTLLLSLLAAGVLVVFRRVSPRYLGG
jgi:hypothetical protein